MLDFIYSSFSDDFFFFFYLSSFAGVPRCIRTDAGTENVTIINMQKALRWYHDDEQSGEKSVIVGSSHSNQAMHLLLNLSH